MSQYSVPPAVTGSLPNRCTSCSTTPASLTCPAITRPPDAPRSTAATVTPVISGLRYLKKAAATPASTGMSRPVVSDRSPAHSAATAAATCSGSTSRLSSVRCA